VTSSRRNLLGPLHQVEKYPVWTGPDSFVTTGEHWTDDYVQLPYGLMENPILSVRVKVDPFVRSRKGGHSERSEESHRSVYTRQLEIFRLRFATLKMTRKGLFTKGSILK